MTVYIDSDYKCHAEAADGLRAFDVPALDGKCPGYINGSRYVPFGEEWTRSDGKVFKGEMVAPCIDSRVREAYQAQYEESLAELNAAYQEGVNSI